MVLSAQGLGGAQGPVSGLSWPDAAPEEREGAAAALRLQKLWPPSKRGAALPTPARLAAASVSTGCFPWSAWALAACSLRNGDMDDLGLHGLAHFISQ